MPPQWSARHEQIREIVNDPGFLGTLEAAAANPGSRAAKMVLKKVLPMVSLCSRPVPWGAVERGSCIAKRMPPSFVNGTKVEYHSLVLNDDAITDKQKLMRAWAGDVVTLQQPPVSINVAVDVSLASLPHELFSAARCAVARRHSCARRC